MATMIIMVVGILSMLMMAMVDAAAISIIAKHGNLNMLHHVQQ